MANFKFTIKIATGQTYTYNGSVESLAKHLSNNSHLNPVVLEDRTEFATESTKGDCNGNGPESHGAGWEELGHS